MKPAIFSVLKNKEDGTGWIRGGNNIKYKKNKILKVCLKNPIPIYILIFIGNYSDGIMLLYTNFPNIIFI